METLEQRNLRLAANTARYRARHPDQVEEAKRKQREKRAANPEYFRGVERKSAANLRLKINLLKLERGCYDCGVLGLLPSCYEWDHLPEKGKSFQIGARMKSYGLDSVIAEIKKCQCVCANCHRLRTESRRKERGELVPSELQLH